MAKSREKQLARVLRREGKSIREIASVLKVSKGSISLWCRDIVLSKNWSKYSSRQRMQEKREDVSLHGSGIERRKGEDIKLTTT